MRSVAPTPSSNRMTSPTNHAFVMVPRRSVSTVSGSHDWRVSEAPVEYSSEDNKDNDYSGEEHAEWEDILEPLRDDSFAVRSRPLSTSNRRKPLTFSSLQRPALTSRGSCPHSRLQSKDPEVRAVIPRWRDIAFLLTRRLYQASTIGSCGPNSSGGSIPPTSPSITHASTTSPFPLPSSRHVRAASTHTLESVSRPGSAHSHSHSRASAPPDIVTRLTASALPRADAEHLAGVLASLGVTNAAYLRVFGKMRTRDAWLEELRVVGRLTEIQARVVRELVERAAEDGDC